ncbi:cytochrome c1 [Magnetococcus marinus MC-1]|uniref:Cytochrome c1 n=1 Tax=Magnetococcus marinus (strain ATCC BAA-1437 / JCM 17883 / MC-1) TaxID=156889 RepID=A0L4I9_MAGMM|nr:cytochrome c1 [Magnetococcus marinus]ABK42882.1 cytochrome c1 [Magnetococcus marinus MC-1]
MNLKKALALSALVLGLAVAPQMATASGNAVELPNEEWSHLGPFGKFDKAQIKRGIQVATEVCMGCHSIKYLKFDQLRQFGITEDEVNNMAGNYNATKLDKMLTGLAPEDAKESYGTVPPDLSLMTKARKGYENYLYGILTGYLTDDEAAKVSEASEDGNVTDEEAKHLAEVLHMDPHNLEAVRKAVTRINGGDNFNKYFAGHFFAMPKPMGANQVEYADGTKATLEQQAKDVTAFLAWASEPNLEKRKATGKYVILYLLLLTGMLYAVKRRIWSRIH